MRLLCHLMIAASLACSVAALALSAPAALASAAPPTSGMAQLLVITAGFALLLFLAFERRPAIRDGYGPAAGRLGSPPDRGTAVRKPPRPTC